MSDSAATGGDPATVDAMNDASPLAAREAEVTEEQHLDDRHATGEHYTGAGGASAGSDPLLDLDENLVDATIEDPDTNLGRGIDNI
jgi:hypothetical protein